MTKMTGPDSGVMCNLKIIHTYIPAFIHTYIDTYRHTGQDDRAGLRGYVHVNIYIYIYLHTYYIHTYIHP